MLFRQLLYPPALFGSFRNDQPASGADRLKSCLSGRTGGYERASRNQPGTTDPLTTMDGDVLALFQGVSQVFQQLNGGFCGRRYSPIHDRKREEAKPVGLCKLTFLLQLELFVFSLFEKRHDDVDAGALPAPYFVLQPITATRPRRDAEAAAPWAWNPK
jgi:hypothetical protein